MSAQFPLWYLLSWSCWSAPACPRLGAARQPSAKITLTMAGDSLPHWLRNGRIWGSGHLLGSFRAVDPAGHRCVQGRIPGCERSAQGWQQQRAGKCVARRAGQPAGGHLHHHRIVHRSNAGPAGYLSSLPACRRAGSFRQNLSGLITSGSA